jgi:hypothetical protein
MSARNLPGLAVWLAVAASMAGPAGRSFAAVAAPRSALALHAEAGPDGAPLGERLQYRGWIVLPHAQRVNWITPNGGDTQSWSALRTSRVPGGGGMDTARVDGEVQLFTLGRVDIAGPRFTFPDGSAGEHTLPVVRVIVRPTLSAADSNARLRPVRGPLVAPWWERVRWLWVAAGLAGLALMVAWVVWRRRRRAAPPALPALPADPVAETLLELAALRRLNLPAQGRYAEHAFQLTLILRRFLERTAGGLKPGLTSGELVGWLSRNPTRVDVARLDALLRVWDRIKFARAPGSLEQARDAEMAVEAWVRAHAGAAEREVA